MPTETTDSPEWFLGFKNIITIIGGFYIRRINFFNINVCIYKNSREVINANDNVISANSPNLLSECDVLFSK